MELRSACLPLLRANPPASDITASDAVHLLALEIITDGGHAVASSWPPFFTRKPRRADWATLQ
jgi:hypothetical protein